MVAVISGEIILVALSLISAGGKKDGTVYHSLCAHDIMSAERTSPSWIDEGIRAYYAGGILVAEE